MKPKKNRPICPDCGKPKMLFETEKKAQNFIKYNGQNIIKENQTLDDIRIYYCPSCCGYHITTKKFKRAYEHNTDKLIDAYDKIISVIVPFHGTDEEIVNDIMEKAKKELISCKKDMTKFITNYIVRKYGKIEKCREDEIRHHVYTSFKYVKKV